VRLGPDRKGADTLRHAFRKQEPKPIWDSSGSLDFHGRECWEAWKAFKGMSEEDAKHAFCSIYAEALERRSTNFRG
jgi:acyl-CoA-binding protein